MTASRSSGLHADGTKPCPNQSGGSSTDRLDGGDPLLLAPRRDAGRAVGVAMRSGALPAAVVISTLLSSSPALGASIEFTSSSVVFDDSSASFDSTQVVVVEDQAELIRLHDRGSTRWPTPTPDFKSSVVVAVLHDTVPCSSSLLDVISEGNRLRLVYGPRDPEAICPQVDSPVIDTISMVRGGVPTGDVTIDHVSHGQLIGTYEVTIPSSLPETGGGYGVAAVLVTAGAITNRWAGRRRPREE